MMRSSSSSHVSLHIYSYSTHVVNPHVINNPVWVSHGFPVGAPSPHPPGLHLAWKRSAVSVTASRKPERGPLSCCSRGPPEGPGHPLIKYTSPSVHRGWGWGWGGRTLFWDGHNAGSPAGCVCGGESKRIVQMMMMRMMKMIQDWLN